MINKEERQAIIKIVHCLEEIELDVEYWIEFDSMTASAFLVFSVKGDLGNNVNNIMDIVQGVLVEPPLNTQIGSVYTSQSKGRGRPKKSGEPPAEGLVIKCVLL